MKSRHGRSARHGQHRRADGIRHLVLNNFRRLSRVIGLNDDLNVGKVGKRIHGRLQHRNDAGDREQKRAEKNEYAIFNRGADDAFNHFAAPWGCAAAEGVGLLRSSTVWGLDAVPRNSSGAPCLMPCGMLLCGSL